MRRFARLFAELDQTNKTNEKIDAMSRYFTDTSDRESAAWALYFLSGQRLQRLISSSLLRDWAIELSAIEPWLFDECYEAVGDLGETISLIVPKPVEQTSSMLREAAASQASVPHSGRADVESIADQSLAFWVEHLLLPLRVLTAVEQRAAIVRYWCTLDQVSCLVMNKLLTGSFRVGVSQKLVVRALANATGMSVEVLAHRMMGRWQPSASFFDSLLDRSTDDASISRPYPFFLANPLELDVEQLGDISDWQIEWKWDGIRAQIIRRKGQAFIWSRGEELMTDRFPELRALADLLPDGTVLDGEIVACRDGQILPFASLQRRIGRQQLGPKILRDVPVAYLAFDLLETEGQDFRSQPLLIRRSHLVSLFHALRNRTGISASLLPERTGIFPRSSPGLLFGDSNEPLYSPNGTGINADHPSTKRTGLSLDASNNDFEERTGNSSTPKRTGLSAERELSETDPLLANAGTIGGDSSVSMPSPGAPQADATAFQIAAEFGGAFMVPSVLTARSWQEIRDRREQSRTLMAEGLMLKRLVSPYRVGRPRGDWWKWKVEPYSIDAVLIYAQRGHGKRASLYTDYTFGVWDGDQLVPFAKAYSGLTDAEISKVDHFVRQNTLERFGPVRRVQPELVFELAFENIQLSTRHRSGIAVRFPRILRWRKDKLIRDADSLETIKAMLAQMNRQT